MRLRRAAPVPAPASAAGRGLRALVLLAALAGCACGAALRADAVPVTNPLDDRRDPTVAPRAPEAGTLLAEPEPPGPGGATDAEGAAVRALEYLAEVFDVPARALSVDRVTELPGGPGWHVVVRDAFRNPHSVDVSPTATTWLGETRAEGILVARDEVQRVAIVQSHGRPLTLRLPRAGTARTAGVAPGTPVAFAYDVSARGDGSLVLATLEARP